MGYFSSLEVVLSITASQKKLKALFYLGGCGGSGYWQWRLGFNSDQQLSNTQAVNHDRGNY